MLNLCKTSGFLSAVLVGGLTFAPAAYAQIGDVTGSVGGTVGSASQIGTMTDIRTKTRIDSRAKVKTPDVRTKTPDVRAKVNAPTSVGVKATAPGSVGVRSRSYHGSHYHGAYAHDHGHYGYDHFHDHAHSHNHGYANVTVRVEAEAKDETPDITPMLTFGTQVRSESGENLGVITGITRVQGGTVSAVNVGSSFAAIPVSSLSAEGDVLVTSMTKAQLDG